MIYDSNGRLSVVPARGMGYAKSRRREVRPTMRRRRVMVHHCVMNTTTRQYGPRRMSDLLGVNYWHHVPPDTEFPYDLGRVDLFTRFYVTGASPTEFFVRVWWLDAPRGKPELAGHFGPFRVDFRPDESVRDHPFRIYNVRVNGVGRHAIRLLRRRPGGWRAGRLAVQFETHFSVVR
jgi:hypothetical protein